MVEVRMQGLKVLGLEELIKTTATNTKGWKRANSQWKKLKENQTSTQAVGCSQLFGVTVDWQFRSCEIIAKYLHCTVTLLASYWVNINLYVKF